MKCSELIKQLNTLCPKDYAMPWDNPGLIAGDADQDIRTVYIALDATDAVVADAIEAGADFILTHHPLVFGAMKQINTDNFIGRRLVRILQNHMCCFAMHTNFDVAVMADEAASRLALATCRVLQKTGEISIDGQNIPVGIGKVGSLEKPMTLKEYALFVKEAFRLQSVSIFGPMDTQIHTAAVCPGSGKSTIDDAAASGAQVLVTGDIGHHDGIDALAKGLTIIDAGHQGLEQIFIGYMQRYFSKNIPELKIVTEISRPPFTVI